MPLHQQEGGKSRILFLLGMTAHHHSLGSWVFQSGMPNQHSLEVDTITQIKFRKKQALSTGITGVRLESH